jgi:hypothetical protein
VLDEEFIKDRVQKLQEIAKGADPFIKRRLLELAVSYEKRLGKLPPPIKLPSIGITSSDE